MESITLSNLRVDETRGFGRIIVTGNHGEESKYALSASLVKRIDDLHELMELPGELVRQRSSFNERANTLTVNPDLRRSQFYNPDPKPALIAEAAAQAIALRGIEPYRVVQVLDAVSLCLPHLVYKLPHGNESINQAA